MSDGAGWALALNAGSSSLKLGAYGLDGAPLAEGAISDIDVMRLADRAMTDAVAALTDGRGLAAAPAAVGHRVVHGLDLHAPVVIDAGARATIERAAAFAPLHNPPALRVIDLAETLFPAAMQVACFDTAFHATDPAVSTTFPLPTALREAGLRRYGFHGLSFASLVRRFGELTGRPLPHRLLACHLGAGCSLAAIVDGKGVATTMGFSPTDGLVMATRSGAMDPGVLVHLMRGGMDADAIERLLNRESGLKALANEPSMKALLARDDAEARFAVDHFVHWALRHAGAMIAAMEGVDGVVFTGGIGEHAAPIRERMTAGLGWAGVSPDAVWVAPADEAGEIAHSTLRLLGV